MKSLPEHAGVRAILSEKFPNAVASFEEKLVRAGYLDAYADLYGAMRTTLHEIDGFCALGDSPGDFLNAGRTGIGGEEFRRCNHAIDDR